MASTQQMQARAKARKAALKATVVEVTSEEQLFDDIHSAWGREAKALSDAMDRNRSINLSIAFDPIFKFGWKDVTDDYGIYKNKYNRDISFEVYDIQGKPFANGYAYCIQLVNTRTGKHLGILAKAPGVMKDYFGEVQQMTLPAAICCTALLNHHNMMMESLFKAAFAKQAGFRRVLD